MNEVPLFVCKNAMLGVGCGMPEMLVLGIIFIISAFISIAFLAYHFIRCKKNNQTYMDLLTAFWVSMILYLLFRGIIQIVPFHYTIASLLIVHAGFNAILALIPISIFVLMIIELLLTYKNPGLKTMYFFRIIFVVFLSVFLIVAIVISTIDQEEMDPLIIMALWHGCTDFLAVFFVAIPTVHLIRAISYPVVQPEDASCVKWSTVGVWVFSITFSLRGLHNILQFCGVNPIITWITIEMSGDGGRPTAAARAFQFAFTVVFELCTAVMGAVGALVLKKHDMQFADDPFYARAPSTTSLLSRKYSNC